MPSGPIVVPEELWILITTLCEGLVFLLMVYIRVASNLKARIVSFIGAIMAMVIWAVTHNIGLALAVFYAVRSSSNLHGAVKKVKAADGSTNYVVVDETEQPSKTQTPTIKP